MNNELYTKKHGITTRWANPENITGEKGAAAQEFGGRKGNPCIRHIKPGETRILAEAQGAGIIRHIWIASETRDKKQIMKAYKLEIFWDGEEKPAVSVPLCDFFCFNSGMLSPMENEYFSNPEGRTFNCYIPMPFKKGMKITVTNETKKWEEIQFFYQVDYTLGDDVSDALYFHAFYNREDKTVTKKDYTILPYVKGCGRYLGASFGVIANPLMGKSWWGEGEVKCYINGDSDFPTLAGTGTEDYIGTGWGQGRYAQRYQGCPYADFDTMRYSFYRFHTVDPVYFEQDIRITIQQIGCTGKEDIVKMLDNGLEVFRTDGAKIDYSYEGAAFERFDDDWCSVAYFYLDTPISELPGIQCAEDRIRGYQSIN